MRGALVSLCVVSSARSSSESVCGVQCEELRARIQACEVDPLDEAEAVFLTAETIYCSPLTR